MIPVLVSAEESENSKLYSYFPETKFLYNFGTKIRSYSLSTSTYRMSPLGGIHLSHFPSISGW